MRPELAPYSQGRLGALRFKASTLRSISSTVWITPLGHILGLIARPEPQCSLNHQTPKGLPAFINNSTAMVRYTYLYYIIIQLFQIHFRILYRQYAMKHVDGAIVHIAL